MKLLKLKLKPLAGLISLLGIISAADVWFPDTSGFFPGQSISIPIHSSDLSGLGINSYYSGISFDSALIEFAGATASGSISQVWGNPSTNLIQPGLVNIAMFGTSALSGVGVLVYLDFDIIGPAGQSSSLEFDYFYFNEGNPSVSTINGSVTISEIYGCTDSQALNYDPMATIDDESCIYYYDCEGVANGEAFEDECGICSGGNTEHVENSDVDCDGVCFGNSVLDQCGECNGNGWDMCDFDNDGIPNLEDYGPGPHAFVSIPEVSGFFPGDTAIVSITTSDLTELQVHSYLANITYNPEIVSLLGLDYSNSLTSNWPAPIVNDTEGILILAAFGQDPLAGEGTLVSLNFIITGEEGEYSPLIFNQFVYNEGFPQTETTDGSITISEIYGCTDPEALNYDETATQDDGSCILYYDCEDIANGPASVDLCGICSEGNTGHEANSDLDCSGVCFGTANLDDCGICSGGITGHIENFEMDECGICFGSGPTTWYPDTDSDGLGDGSAETVVSCDQPDGYVDNNIDLYPECTSNYVDECSICNGNNTSCADCAGIPNGANLEDNCGTCDSDETNDCVQDCAGDWGGSGVIDVCGECGGNDWDLCDDDDDEITNYEQWGYSAYEIEVQDIPNDQGNWVNISFHASILDDEPIDRNPDLYHIQRNDDTVWTSVASAPAIGLDHYNVEAHTYQNTIITDEGDTLYNFTEFRIIASFDEGDFISNQNGIGYSVDNIHPTTPSDMSASHLDNNITVNWDYVLEEDFNYHEITGLWNNSNYSIENSYSFILDSHDENWVQSVDIHGNSSQNSESIMSISLHVGANLKSFNVLAEDSSITNVMESIEGVATGVIGEGVAANYSGSEWMGSLSEIDPNSGYWIMVSEDDVVLLMGEPTSRELAYTLHEGANLISYPFRYETVLEEALPEGIGCDISGIIGEGVAATCMNGNWMGSLSHLEGSYGYWFKTSSDISLTFNGCDEQECASLSRQQSQTIITNPEGYEFVQSTEQAFYFLESIENIEMGDWILSYNDDVVIGAREWQGSIIDIPAMGNDGSDYTKGYIETGSVPSFKILRGDELINLEGDIPAFENNQLYMVSSLTEAVVLPQYLPLHL